MRARYLLALAVSYAAWGFGVGLLADSHWHPGRWLMCTCFGVAWSASVLRGRP